MDSVADLAVALRRLDTVEPGVAAALTRLAGVVAAEAARTPRFARALREALTVGEPVEDSAAPAANGAASATSNGASARGGTASAKSNGAGPRSGASRAVRGKGLFDPFPVYQVSGEAGLRARLRTLSVDQLKDIIAEHGMNYDKAAMRWKTQARLIDRIAERVAARSAKGTVLR